MWFAPHGWIVLAVYAALTALFACFRSTRVAVPVALIIGITSALMCRYRKTGDDLDGFLIGIEFGNLLAFGLGLLFLINIFLFTKSSRSHAFHFSTMGLLACVGVIVVTGILAGTTCDPIFTTGAMLVVAYVAGYLTLFKPATSRV